MTQQQLDGLDVCLSGCHVQAAHTSFVNCVNITPVEQQQLRDRCVAPARSEVQSSAAVDLAESSQKMGGTGRGTIQCSLP